MLRNSINPRCDIDVEPLVGHGRHASSQGQRGRRGRRSPAAPTKARSTPSSARKGRHQGL
uniref:Uncharacterized protein n=1 Tax=Oryza punctata TaxID=4537 RepID=A0A0E0M0Z5_ORYPU